MSKKHSIKTKRDDCIFLSRCGTEIHFSLYVRYAHSSALLTPTEARRVAAHLIAVAEVLEPETTKARSDDAGDCKPSAEAQMQQECDESLARAATVAGLTGPMHRALGGGQ